MNRYKLSKAGINANEGIKRFNGSVEVYEKMIFQFPDDTHFKELCDAIHERNPDAAFSAAHALKGVAGNLSLTLLYNSIVPLVEELRQGSLERANEMLQPVINAYELVIAVLKNQ